MDIPRYRQQIFRPKLSKYCVVIPVINEGEKIRAQLGRMKDIAATIDVIIADGGSSDGSLDEAFLRAQNVQSLLIKEDGGKLGAQLRLAYSFALAAGYEGIITVDGNGKDSIETIPEFCRKLEAGYDFVQGSRYLPGGQAINTPWLRALAVKYLHVPVISRIAGFRFTDTTNGYRAYSRRYLNHPAVQPFRAVFATYELLAYLSVRASQLGLNVIEIPVTRSYPGRGRVPTKISAWRGNFLLITILIKLALGRYNP
jgi:dolichol-phosphate mannosyltransferase